MIRTRLSAWVFTAALSAAVSMGAAAHAQIREGAAAVVNDEVISTYDLKQRMLMMIGRSGVQPTAENQAELQQQALYSLIDERLKLQELRQQERERGAQGRIIIPDEEVDQEIRQLAQRNRLTPEQ